MMYCIVEKRTMPSVSDDKDRDKDKVHKGSPPFGHCTHLGSDLSKLVTNWYRYSLTTPHFFPSSPTPPNQPWSWDRESAAEVEYRSHRQVKLHRLKKASKCLVGWSGQPPISSLASITVLLTRFYLVLAVGSLLVERSWNLKKPS